MLFRRGMVGVQHSLCTPARCAQAGVMYSGRARRGKKPRERQAVHEEASWAPRGQAAAREPQRPWGKNEQTYRHQAIGGNQWSGAMGMCKR